MAYLLCRLHDIGPDEISLIARKAANVFLIRVVDLKIQQLVLQARCCRYSSRLENYSST